MSLTAPRSYPAYDPVHLVGEVRQAAEDGYTVHCDGRDWTCRRAASCLLAPSLGDTVLISGPDPERIYLIAVIEQADPSTARLDTQGALLIASREGGIAVESARGVTLRAGETLHMESADLALRTQQADCTISTLHYRGKTAQMAIGTAKLVGKVYEVAVDRLVQLARNALRMTDEVDQTRAGTLDIEGAQMTRVHGKYSVVTGEELVKVDARQIHMG